MTDILTSALTAEERTAMRHAFMSRRELAEEGFTDVLALYDHEVEVLADACERLAQENARLTAKAEKEWVRAENADAKGILCEEELTARCRELAQALNTHDGRTCLDAMLVARTKQPCALCALLAQPWVQALLQERP